MSIHLTVPPKRELKPRIVVFGIGGAGGNAVNNMVSAGLEGVDFVVANTDAQALAASQADRPHGNGMHGPRTWPGRPLALESGATGAQGHQRSSSPTEVGHSHPPASGHSNAGATANNAANSANAETDQVHRDHPDKPAQLDRSARPKRTDAV